MDSPVIQKARLLILASHLERVPPDRFNFSLVVDPKQWKGHQDLSCGASACALGLCPSIPEFFSLGLRLQFIQRKMYVGASVALIQKGAGSIADSDSWEQTAKTAADFFGLTPKAVEFLFLPGQEYYDELGDEHESFYHHRNIDGPLRLPDDATPLQVAARIRLFVAESP